MSTRWLIARDHDGNQALWFHRNSGHRCAESPDPHFIAFSSDRQSASSACGSSTVSMRPAPKWRCRSLTSFSAGAGESEQQCEADQRIMTVSQGIPSLRFSATATHDCACPVPGQCRSADASRRSRRTDIIGAIGCAAISAPAKPSELGSAIRGAATVSTASGADAGTSLAAVRKTVGMCEAWSPEWRALTGNTTSGATGLSLISACMAARPAVLPVRAGVTAGGGATCARTSAAALNASGVAGAARGAGSAGAAYGTPGSRRATRGHDAARAGSAARCQHTARPGRSAIRSAAGAARRDAEARQAGQGGKVARLVRVARAALVTDRAGRGAAACAAAACAVATAPASAAAAPASRRGSESETSKTRLRYLR